MIKPHLYWTRMRRRIHAWEDAWVDLALGIRTARPTNFVPPMSKGSDADEYYPVRGSRLLSVLRKAEISPGDAFLDIGCGMGRAMALASFFPFEKICGWELSPELARHARANLRAIRRNPLRRCDKFEITNGDASAIPVPDDINCIFLFNPFGESTLRAVAGNVSRSLQRAPRRVKIIYFAPVYCRQLTNALEASGSTVRIAHEEADHAFIELDFPARSTGIPSAENC